MPSEVKITNEVSNLYSISDAQVQEYELVDCTHFTTNLLQVNEHYERDLAWLQSFVIYICTEGSGTLRYSGGELPVAQNDVYLIPAIEQSVTFEGTMTLLESFC